MPQLRDLGECALYSTGKAWCLLQPIRRASSWIRWEQNAVGPRDQENLTIDIRWQMSDDHQIARSLGNEYLSPGEYTHIVLSFKQGIRVRWNRPVRARLACSSGRRTRIPIRGRQERPSSGTARDRWLMRHNIDETP